MARQSIKLSYNVPTSGRSPQVRAPAPKVEIARATPSAPSITIKTPIAPRIARAK